jgi:hypothetical protein
MQIRKKQIMPKYILDHDYDNQNSTTPLVHNGPSEFYQIMRANSNKQDINFPIFLAEMPSVRAKCCNAAPWLRWLERF